jgi:hypothetical protein
MDIRIDGQRFEDTLAVVSYVSDAGKALFAQLFGDCALSVEMPKSRAIDFSRYCEQKGLEVSCP